MSNAENKPRVILILQYLMKNTDDLHTVTISDITEHLKASGIEANRHTIMHDIQQLQVCGFDIICQRSRMNQYSIGERILELPELKLLIDAVEAARFIPQPKSEALIEKLSSLASQYQAKHLSSNIHTNKRVKSDNARVYYSIDLINQAISENKMIRFQYFSYLPTKEKALKYDGMFYRFSPHRITWSNDSYYVIGLNYKYNNEVVYRIDRMTSLEIMDEEAKPVEEGFDMESFLKSNFLMFDGELTRVTLKCDKGMMNSIIDKFGEDVGTFYDAEQDPEHFYAYADAATGPTFYSWVFNYQGKIRIVEPQNIRDEFMVEAWTGCRSAFKADVLKAVVAFVKEYSGKYSRERLITRLKAEDPETIYRAIRSDFDTPVELRYVAPIVKIYNGNSMLNALGNGK